MHRNTLYHSIMMVLRYMSKPLKCRILSDDSVDCSSIVCRVAFS